MIHLQDNPKFQVGDRVKAVSAHLGTVRGKVTYIRETAGQFYLTVEIGDGITVGGNQNGFVRDNGEDNRIDVY